MNTYWHICIGPEPVLAAHARSPTAADSHSPAGADSAPHSEQNFFALLTGQRVVGPDGTVARFGFEKQGLHTQATTSVLPSSRVQEFAGHSAQLAIASSSLKKPTQTAHRLSTRSRSPACRRSAFVTL